MRLVTWAVLAVFEDERSKHTWDMATDWSWICGFNTNTGLRSDPRNYSFQALAGTAWLVMSQLYHSPRNAHWLLPNFYNKCYQSSQLSPKDSTAPNLAAPRHKGPGLWEKPKSSEIFWSDLIKERKLRELNTISHCVLTLKNSICCALNWNILRKKSNDEEMERKSFVFGLPDAYFRIVLWRCIQVFLSNR